MCYSAMIRNRCKDYDLDFEARIQSDGWNAFENYRNLNAKKCKIPGSDNRIYPNYFAPIIVFENGERVIKPMRYQVFPSNPTYKTDPQNLALFNARRDTLTKKNGLWIDMFSKQHGIFVFEKFFEWVTVKDLIASGVVTLDSVRAYFEKQELEKKNKAIAKGKAYEPAKTALTPAMERKIEIEFSRRDKQTMIAPVLWDKRKLADDFEMFSFAIITDKPPPEVAATGHDRCPVLFKKEGMSDWLQPQGKSIAYLDSILTRDQNINTLTPSLNSF